jgi:hypothetical protein
VVLTATFFAIFCVDNLYLASRDAGFLQHALTLLVNLFQRVGLWTNTYKNTNNDLHTRLDLDPTSD